jgi:hypothetical protein
MSLENLYIRLEIAFWDAIIPLMHQSRLVQVLLQHAYQLVRNRDHTRLAMQALFVTSLGLILGFVIGFIRAHLL